MLKIEINSLNKVETNLQKFYKKDEKTGSYKLLVEGMCSKSEKDKLQKELDIIRNTPDYKKINNLKNIINEIRKEIKKKLDEVFNNRIQTIPADIRSAIIGHIKTNPKTYEGQNWYNFTQLCQNIQREFISSSALATSEQIQQVYASHWVIIRIQALSDKKRSLKQELTNMNAEDLCLFNFNDIEWSELEALVNKKLEQKKK